MYSVEESTPSDWVALQDQGRSLDIPAFHKSQISKDKPSGQPFNLRNRLTISRLMHPASLLVSESRKQGDDKKIYKPGWR
jgi:hypothetical protein